MYTYPKQVLDTNTKVRVILDVSILDRCGLRRYVDMWSLLEEFLPYVYHVATEGLDDPSWMSSLMPDLEELVHTIGGEVTLEELIEESYIFMDNLMYILRFSGVFMYSDVRYTYELENYDPYTRTAFIRVE